MPAKWKWKLKNPDNKQNEFDGIKKEAGTGKALRPTNPQKAFINNQQADNIIYIAHTPVPCYA